MKKNTLENKVKTDSSSKKKEKNYLGLGLNYVSNAVYNGRIDSGSNLNYITPSIGFHHTSGLFLNSTFAYLKDSGRIDETVIELGYEYHIREKISGELNASKIFYNKNSSAVNASATGSLNASFSYDLNFISLEAELGLIFQDQTDVSSSISISHGFELGDEANQFTITPTIHANAGTQNYYDVYHKKGKKKNAPPAESVQNHSKFQLLDYELSLPISFERKKWSITFTPFYSIPKNPATTNYLFPRTRRNYSITEVLGNTLYSELAFAIKIFK